MSETAQERWQPRTLTSIPTSRKSLEEVADSARQTGYAEGFAKGEQEANQQGNQKVQELMALWASMEKPLANQDAEVSEHLLSLVMAMVRAVLRRELTTDETFIRSTLEEALQALAESRAPLEIRLNPADKAAVETHLGEQRLTAELVADNLVLRGGCHVSRGHALVDATIEQQCRALLEQLVSVDQTSETAADSTTPLDPDRISEIASRFAPGGNDDD